MLESIERRLNPPDRDYPFRLNATRIKQLDALATKIGTQAPLFWQYRDLIPVAEEEIHKLFADWIKTSRREQVANLAALAAHKSERRRKSFAVIVALSLAGILFASASNGSSVIFLALAFQYWIVWLNVDFNKKGTSPIGIKFRRAIARAYFYSEFVPVKSTVDIAPNDTAIYEIALVVATKASKTLGARKDAAKRPKQK
jgi:hypothetical protein